MARLLGIPYNKYLKFRLSFQRNCESSGLILDMTKISPRKTEGFEAFVGDSKKSTQTKKLPYLFDFEAVGSQREKYGISKDINAVVYIPQASLEQAFGIKKFDDLGSRTSYRNFKIRFKEEDFIIDAVNYLEELYGMCVAIQLNLKTDKKGG
jgi:hypothetical protein